MKVITPEEIELARTFEEEIKEDARKLEIFGTNYVGNKKSLNQAETVLVESVNNNNNYLNVCAADIENLGVVERARSLTEKTSLRLRGRCGFENGSEIPPRSHLYSNNEKEEKQHIQKTALVRYNPFGETGGNQSFVLSLLDADGEGFVITSLHNRDYTRVYAKEVRVEGKPEGKNDSFSKEEREAISLASKKHG